MTRSLFRLSVGILLALCITHCGSDGGGDGSDPGGVPEGMVLVPAGEFKMGCNGQQGRFQCSSDEAPVHTVSLDSYYIDTYEVTAGQYKACVDAGKCTAPSHDDEGHSCTYNRAGAENYAVNCVSWFEANQYCTAQGKRLPTEAEWEKAARGTDERIFPWGNANPDSSYAMILGGPVPVGRYPKGVSAHGVYDMAGNVIEWCKDWYSSTYYSVSPAHNPTGPATGETKVWRGGGGYTDTSIETPESAIRSSNRDSWTPQVYQSLIDVGFRCAKSP